MTATLDPILSHKNSFFSILILSSHLHLVLSSVVLPWGFLTHFDGISHIIFLCVNIVIMCRSVNYEVPQTQKSNMLVERRMYFEFFTIFLNRVLWMFSLLRKCGILWSNFCIVPCDKIYKLHWRRHSLSNVCYCGLESSFFAVSGSYVFY